MILRHVGLACRSEAEADRFYVEVLGLGKQPPRELTAEMAREIFGVPAELKMINYVGPGAHVEVFITGAAGERPVDAITHACIAVDDLDAFLADCLKAQVTVRRIRKGDRLLTFVHDYDGNLFEVQQMTRP